jgi:hypothetical protein
LLKFATFVVLDSIPKEIQSASRIRRKIGQSVLITGAAEFGDELAFRWEQEVNEDVQFLVVAMPSKFA